MGTVSSIVKQLKKERDRVEKQLSGLNAAISAFGGHSSHAGAYKDRKRRKLSAKAIANIRAAQKKRWAKVRAAKKAA